MQVTRTYELKLKPNKLQKQQLDNYFYEAKCLYNYFLNCSNIFAVNSCKVKHIWKLDKDKSRISVTISSLPAKLRQNVHRNMLNSIKALSASKSKGNSVGRLKFKSEINYIEFDNQSFKVLPEGYVKLAGFGRAKMKCFGIQQFEDVVKFRNAILVKKPNGFYLKVCITKEVLEHELTNKNVGIDFGIKDCITLSTGEKFNCKLKETDRLKKLSKRYNRMLLINKRRTNNSQKVRNQLKREYEKLNNRKKDFSNKLLHYLDSFDHIVFQDEQLSAWKTLKSTRKTIQRSCLGTIKNKLEAKVSEEPERYSCLDKRLPTTKMCPQCGTRNELSLENRIYVCSCGYTCDRDIHAAKNMLRFSKLT